MSFEPKLLGILCHWCSYSGADGAGAARQAYPANLRVVRVMCSGRVDPAFVLGAFAKGFDGVLVCGCHPGDCHYINGNCKALGRLRLLRRLTSGFGIEPERLRLEWVSATEGERYARLVTEMTEQVRTLGPLSWRARDDLAAAPMADGAIGSGPEMPVDAAAVADEPMASDGARASYPAMVVDHPEAALDAAGVSQGTGAAAQTVAEQAVVSDQAATAHQAAPETSP
jgi:F420-non-reducing hydrogenase iron-sulfur subunit